MKNRSSRRRVSQRKRFLFLVVQIWIVVQPVVPKRSPYDEQPFGDFIEIDARESENCLALPVGTAVMEIGPFPTEWSPLVGITDDLEWMHRPDIGGFMLADINYGRGQVVDSTAPSETPEWFTVVRHAPVKWQADFELGGETDG